MIIFDSSPLIHLTKIGKIAFVLELFKTAFIPEAVYEEVVIKGLSKGFSDAQIIEAYIKNSKIKVEKISEVELASFCSGDLINYLNNGELESILLSEKKKTLLAIDERKGRLFCEQKKIPTITTSTLLLLLVEKDIIDSDLYEVNLSKYASNGWISIDIYREYIKKGKN